MSDKRLYLLDGMPLLYRGHFVFMRNPRVTSKGVVTSAVFGFTASLMKVLEAGRPTHIAVVFDSDAPTFRHKEYPEYKAQREEMPEDIATNIPLAIQVAEALNVPVLRMTGFEADDIIGTLAVRAGQAGFSTWLVTPDKDFGQLVNEHTVILRPAKGAEPEELMGVAEVLAKWDIDRVDQVTDLLGLAGDASDNIPGVPGIGPKTASKLLREFGSLENALASLDALKEKDRARLSQYADQARLSKRLATICCEVPLDTRLEDLALRPPDTSRVASLFRELEFFGFGRKLLGSEFDAAPSAAAAEPQQALLFGDGGPSPSPTAGRPEPAGSAEGAGSDAPGDGSAEPGPRPETTPLRPAANTPHSYHVCADRPQRAELLAQLAASGGFCFDTESSGLDTRTASVVGLSFSIRPSEAWYVPVPRDTEAARAVLDEFRAVFADERIPKTGHNLKFDIGLLRTAGLDVRGPLFDTMLAHYVIEPEQRHGMDHVSRTYLGYDPIPIEALIGPRGADQKNMADVALEQIAEYAAEDADVTLRLREVLEPLVERYGARRALEECENPLIPVLVDMEAEGIRIDHRALEEFSGTLAREIAALEERIYAAAGTHFNIASPKQLGEILFEYMKIGGKPKKTATGQYATSEDILAKLAPDHPIAALVLDYRNCQKLKSTYVDTLPEAVSPATGRVHTTYSQAVAATGRLQSQNPNLQNIPIRTERGREIRKAFVPRDRDHLLLSADYSQIELRVMAELSGDEAMHRTFVQKEDVHQATAARVYGVFPASVTDDMRRKAKMVNFGIIYGISAFGLAQRLGISRTSAQELITEYFRQYPGVRDYMERTVENARRDGFVRTLLGRRRLLPDIHSRNATARQAAERNAINTPIQGTAADMIKLAMIGIHREIVRRGLRTRMLLQVHDELVFDLYRPEEAEMRDLIADRMRHALPMRVPIEIEIGIGENWLEAH